MIPLSGKYTIRRNPYFEAIYGEVRLYELEQAYAGCHFLRCSKSMVLNLMQMDGISPALNGRFFAHMKNGEKIIISRQYVPRLKQIVMGKREAIW